MASGSQGLQGQDIIPREFLDDYGQLLSDYLPGWTITGEYNYHAAPSTQVAAVQMQRILHSGQHPWINDQLNEQA